MNVKEKIRAMKREKTLYSTEELDQLGWARYEEIKDKLEDKYYGQYLAIEVDNGDYFIGKTKEEALEKQKQIILTKLFA